MHEGDPRPGTEATGVNAPGRTAVVYGGALIGGFLVFLAGSVLVTPVVGLVGWLVFAVLVVWQGRRGPTRRRRRGRP